MSRLHPYMQLRYVLLVNVIAALAPAMDVKGRANDPLRNVAWWQFDQHSAVAVVALAALLGTALAFVAARKGIRRWWVFAVCAVVAGDFPATFYLIAAPAGESVPSADMYLTGTLAGMVAGVLLAFLLKGSSPRAAN